MYLLYGDETNLAEQNGKFFIYAGIAIPETSALNLSKTIEEIRVRYGFTPTIHLKFNSAERPAHISTENHTKAKKELLAAAQSHGVKLLCSFLLHDIATSSEDARKNEINRICYHFDCFLNRQDDTGLVFLDTFSGSLRQILQEKFQRGIIGLPYTPEMRLERICGFHEAHIGTSNFTYLVDVIIGTLRYAINERNNPASSEKCQSMLEQLKPLFITDDRNQVLEISCFFSPKAIRVQRYLDEYLALHNFLAENGIRCLQTPTNQRTY